MKKEVKKLYTARVGLAIDKGCSAVSFSDIEF